MAPKFLLKPQTVTSFGNKVFADMIKIRTEMGSCWTWVGPKSNESVLIRREDTQRDTEGVFCA